LQQDALESGRQTLIVLTQIEQVEEQTLANVQALIKQQAPKLPIITVSAHRYRQGLESASALKIKKSGINELRQAVQSALAYVEQTRKDEGLALGESLGGLIDQGLINLQARLLHQQAKRQALLANFVTEYQNLHSKLHKQLNKA
jgi:G3E family GTPase